MHEDLFPFREAQLREQRSSFRSSFPEEVLRVLMNLENRISYHLDFEYRSLLARNQDLQTQLEVQTKRAEFLEQWNAALEEELAKK